MADDKNFREPKKPAEIVEIEEAQEAIRDVLWWKNRLDWTGWIVYAVGFVMWIFQDNDRAVIIILMAIALILFNTIVNGGRLRKRRMVAQNLINAFVRKKTVPLYHELLEKFSDQPHLHIHLSENGTIIITDRRNKENQ